MDQYADRPKRLTQLYVDNPLYFVTACTFRRRTLLASECVHDVFVTFAERALSEHNVAVGRYVIMPDHIHLFVRGGEEFVLSRWVAQMKAAVTRVLRRDGVDGRIWQEGFFDRVLRDDESYGEKWGYVLANPVRASLTEAPEDWPFSGEIVKIDRA